MFNLKATILKTLGLAEKEGETDVEAFARMQEAIEANQKAATTAAAEATANVQGMIDTAVAAVSATANEALANATKQISDLTALVGANDKKNTDAIEALKTQFSQQIASLKAGSDPITTDGETKQTDPKTLNPDDKGKHTVAAWKKPIVSVKQALS